MMEREARRQLRRGILGPLVVGLGAAAVMTALSVWAYPSMAPYIVTREAGGRHGRSAPPKWLVAWILPVAMVLVTAAMVGTQIALQWAIAAANPPVRRSARTAGSVATAAVGGLGLVFLALHAGFVAMFLQRPFPFLSAIACAVGLMAVLLGVVWPLSRVEGAFVSPEWERWRSAGSRGYRPAGYVMVVGGLLAAAIAWWVPVVALVLAFCAVMAGCVIPLTLSVRSATR